MTDHRRFPGSHDRGPIPQRPSIFGADQPCLDLSRHLPPRTNALVVARLTASGIRASHVCLPHQLYPDQVGVDPELIVLPILSPWLIVTGPNAGVALGSHDPYGDLLDQVD